MLEKKQSSKFKIKDKVSINDEKSKFNLLTAEVCGVDFDDASYIYLLKITEHSKKIMVRERNLICSSFDKKLNEPPPEITIKNVANDPQGKTPGFKDDAKKPDLTDIPLDAMWQMGQAFTYGQKKYTKNNYRTGMHVSRQLAAAVRHIYQHLDGQNNDVESGCTHLGHAMASLAMAIYNLKNNPEMDDRFEKDIEKYEVKSE